MSRYVKKVTKTLYITRDGVEFTDQIAAIKSEFITRLLEDIDKEVPCSEITSVEGALYECVHYVFDNRSVLVQHLQDLFEALDNLDDK